MEIPRHIFRSYDIRGLLDEITPEIARRVGQACVQNGKAQTVLVGRDMRSTSEELAAAIAQGVTEMGANVIDIGLCTNSMFNYALSSMPEVDVGTMVTASHNPAEYNGIKVTRASGDPIAGQELFDFVQGDFEPAETPGQVEQKDVLDDYLKKCLEGDLPDLSDVKVVVDYGNGVGVLSIRPLLKRLGVEFIELYPEPDANFPNHEANPAKEETLNDLKAEVLEHNADLGFAFDGDVDRLKIIDEKGESLRSDLFLALVAQYLLKDNSGAAVISTANMSWTVKEVVEDAGGKCFEAVVGRTNVIKLAHKHNAIVGGEVSGHITFREFNNLEAIDYAVVLTLKLWKESGQKMSELVAPLQKYFNTGEVNIEVSDKEKVFRKIEETYVPQATDVDQSDGVKCAFGREWWFIARPSNTEPVIRVNVEAPTEALMNEKLDEIVKLMKSV